MDDKTLLKAIKAIVEHTINERMKDLAILLPELIEESVNDTIKKTVLAEQRRARPKTAATPATQHRAGSAKELVANMYRERAAIQEMAPSVAQNTVEDQDYETMSPVQRAMSGATPKGKYEDILMQTMREQTGNSATDPYVRASQSALSRMQAEAQGPSGLLNEAVDYDMHEVPDDMHEGSEDIRAHYVDNNEPEEESEMMRRFSSAASQKFGL